MILQGIKNKLPQPNKQPQQQQSKQEQIQQQEQQQEVQIENVDLKPRHIKRDSLFVTFSGVIQSGTFDQLKQVTLYYSIAAGNGWKKLNGQRSGTTQMASSNDQKMVWNFPFEIAYETTVLPGWPQLIVVLYGTDFFGKSFVKGYGNIHLPTGGGRQHRKMRIFCPQPRSIISSILGYLQGFIAEYRDIEKVLAGGDGREVTRTRSVGYIDLEIETSAYNFGKFGYQ